MKAPSEINNCILGTKDKPCNLGLNHDGGHFGGGHGGVMFLPNVTEPPADNPINGLFMWAENGHLCIKCEDGLTCRIG